MSARIVPMLPAFALALLLAAAPFVLPSFLTFQCIYAGAYAIAILGLSVLTGASGQISLGHGAFMAVGGYTVAIVLRAANVPPEIIVIASAATAAAAGAIVGLVTLRLHGAYLALATFALAVSIPPLVKRFSSVTGGAQGITLSSFAGQRELYFETWLIAGMLFAVTALLLRGRFGRALNALRDHEIAAVAFGINPLRYKTLAFSLSAAYAGIAGAIVAIATSYVSPDTYGLQLSITLVIGVVLGGLGSLWGAVIGGFVVEFLPLAAQSINPAASSLVYGIALILVMILMPGGIAGTLRTRRR